MPHMWEDFLSRMSKGTQFCCLTPLVTILRTSLKIKICSFVQLQYSSQAFEAADQKSPYRGKLRCVDTKFNI